MGGQREQVTRANERALPLIERLTKLFWSVPRIFDAGFRAGLKKERSERWSLVTSCPRRGQSGPVRDAAFGLPGGEFAIFCSRRSTGTRVIGFRGARIIGVAPIDQQEAGMKRLRDALYKASSHKITIDFVCVARGSCHNFVALIVFVFGSAEAGAHFGGIGQW